MILILIDIDIDIDNDIYIDIDTPVHTLLVHPSGYMKVRSHDGLAKEILSKVETRLQTEPGAQGPVADSHSSLFA